MKPKEKLILEYLGRQDNWVTSKKICHDLSFSRRALQNYIKSIHNYLPGVVLSSNLGFIVKSKAQLASYLEEMNKTTIPQTDEERKTRILKSLLFSNEVRDLDELADELCISTATLNNELIKIKLLLADFDLSFKTKNNQAFIVGLEKNKKKMISSLIFYETKESFMNLDRIQAYLPNYDLHRVRKIVTDCLKQYEYFIDDFSLLNFVLHIAITMERNHLNTTHVNLNKQITQKTTNPHIDDIIRKITLEIENSYDVKFSSADCYDLSLLIMTRVIDIDPDTIGSSKLEEIVGHDVLELVNYIQQRTLNDFLINLNRHDFTVRFSLHIRNLFIRIENDIKLRNPQMLNIKTSFPFIYDISVYIANIINSKMNVIVSEDEIAYIALHIGVLIEEQKALENKVKAIILNPQYFANSLNILKKCIKIFNDSLIISEVISDESEIKDHVDFDILISTIPTTRIIDKPTIIVSEYVDNSDVAQIALAIDHALKYKKVMRIETKLKTMFSEECFAINNTFNNENDAIISMSNQLLKKGYVDETFKQKLFDREAISSSAFGNIAMPHPLEMCSKRSIIAVSIHQKPIQWNSNSVNFIFMLAIHEEDRIIFKDIFDFITDTISNDKKLASLLHVKSFDEFIKLIAVYSN